MPQAPSMVSRLQAYLNEDPVEGTTGHRGLLQSPEKPSKQAVDTYEASDVESSSFSED